MTPPSPEQMAIEIKDKVLKGASYIEVATALRSYGEACVKEYRSIKPAEEDWSDIYDLGEQKGRRSALEEAWGLFAAYGDEHTTRCAHVNYPARSCLCQLPERVKKLWNLKRALLPPEEQK